MENISRSLNMELHDGATDGSVKKARPDTEVDGFDATSAARAPLANDSNFRFGDGSAYIPSVNAGVVRQS
jgi:hypothetical protein